MPHLIETKDFIPKIPGGVYDRSHPGQIEPGSPASAIPVSAVTDRGSLTPDPCSLNRAPCPY